jgi:hypothetical protein
VRSLISSTLATSPTFLPSPSSRSASWSLRTICSGGCFLPFAWFLLAPNGLGNPHIAWTGSRHANLRACHQELAVQLLRDFIHGATACREDPPRVGGAEVELRTAGDRF